MSYYLDKSQFLKFFDTEKLQDPWVDYILTQSDFRLEISLLDAEEWVGILLWKNDQKDWVFDANIHHVEKINFEIENDEIAIKIHVLTRDEPIIKIRLLPTIKISTFY